MKRMMLVLLIVLGSAGIAAAQIGAAPATDVLGAHLNYGRGCPACHAPHSGAFGGGYATTDTNTGNVILWGQDVGNLYGKTITTGSTDGSTGVSETLPANMSTGTPDVTGLLTCLSCHDGNWAKGAMMKGIIYETLPPTYGANRANVPTFLGNNGTGAGNYLNNHPVGLNAVIPCGGSYNWDCTVSATGKIQPGPLMTQFIANYGFFVSPKAYMNQPTVQCTTCHNQHVMNVVAVTNGKNGLTNAASTYVGTGLPTGKYATMFFIRAPYNPADPNPLTNQTAQFCRQCHGGESNEMNGGTAGTVF